MFGHGCQSGQPLKKKIRKVQIDFKEGRLMLMPSIFDDNLFDDFFRDLPFYDDKADRRSREETVWTSCSNLMKTDIKEKKRWI